MKKWILLFLIFLAVIATPVLLAPEKKPSLILQAVGILLSSIIAVTAIWGEHIRGSFAGPKLDLCLRNDKGDLTCVTNGAAVRYYHLRVLNRRSASIARNTRVQIITLQREEKGTWTPKQETYGVEPQWVFSDSSPKNIAYDALCDIVSVYESGDCWISSYIRPNNVDLLIKAGKKVRIEAVAVAENGKSNVLTLEIFWDGSWSKDDNEMKGHLKIKEL